MRQHRDSYLLDLSREAEPLSKPFECAPNFLSPAPTPIAPLADPKINILLRPLLPSDADGPKLGDFLYNLLRVFIYGNIASSQQEKVFALCKRYFPSAQLPSYHTVLALYQHSKGIAEFLRAFVACPNDCYVFTHLDTVAKNFTKEDLAKLECPICKTKPVVKLQPIKV